MSISWLVISLVEDSPYIECLITTPRDEMRKTSTVCISKEKTGGEHLVLTCQRETLAVLGVGLGRRQIFEEPDELTEAQSSNHSSQSWVEDRKGLTSGGRSQDSDIINNKKQQKASALRE